MMSNRMVQRLMNRKNKWFAIAVVFFPLIIMVSGCGVILASDITPPPNAESFGVEDVPEIEEVAYPLLLPDPSRGESIYNEQCAPCHGLSGMGDGELAEELPIPPAALGDPALAAISEPVAWYQIITNGNMERHMPGFSVLDNRSRWDVVAYALSLSMTPESINNGEQIFKENCQDCHGPEGQGSSVTQSWQSDTSLLAQLSLEEITDIIINGRGMMPAFAGLINQKDIEDVSLVIRRMGFAVKPLSTETPQIEVQEPPPDSPILGATGATQEPTIEITSIPEETVNLPTASSAHISTINIAGQVVDATDGILPNGLAVRLSGYDGMEEVLTIEGAVGEEGSFSFNNVEAQENRIFVATIVHQGITYSSDTFQYIGDNQLETVDLFISYYDLTTSLTNLSAERMHLFFDFTNSGVMQVAELYILTNSGKEIIVAEEAGGAVINFELPEGATNLQFDDGQLGDRYIQTERGFADTEIIMPGSGEQLLFSYELPYDRKLNVELPISLNVDAAIIMLPSDGVTLKSDDLQNSGVRDVQGVSLALFTAANLTAGSVLDLTFTGKPSSGVSVAAGDSKTLAIGAGVLGFVLLGLGFWFVGQRKEKSAKVMSEISPIQETAEVIIDQIIALDDLFKAGDIPENAYRSRRKELKDRLKELSE